MLRQMVRTARALRSLEGMVAPPPETLEEMFALASRLGSARVWQSEYTKTYHVDLIIGGGTIGGRACVEAKVTSAEREDLRDAMRDALTRAAKLVAATELAR